MVVGLLLVSTVAAGLAAPVAEPQRRNLDQQVAAFARGLPDLARGARLPGLSALIRAGGRTVWQTGIGFSDIERRVPAGPDTLYQIASLTKTFSAALLLRCVERGRLDLNDPIASITTLIPEPGATVRDVLSHMSAGTPGSRYQYDGNRFAALTDVIERCTGVPYRVALADEILDPFGMSNSVPGHDLQAPAPAVRAMFGTETLSRYADSLARLLSKPYRPGPRSTFMPSVYPPRIINASAGLLSSTNDLAKYDEALDSNGLLRPESRELAWTRATTRSGVFIPYGLGWFVQELAGERIVWHYGLWTGYSALYIKVPNRKLTLLLLANSDGLTAASPLGAGDIATSPFARLFFATFEISGRIR